VRRLIFDTIRAYIRRTRPHPGRGVAARLAWKLLPQEFEDELPTGVRIRVRLCREEDIQYWTGTYDTDGEVGVFLSLLKQGMTVVDVGANIGMYALQASLAVAEGGRVYAFEPVPHIYQRLLEHISLNRASNVLAFPVALSDRNGVATFHLGTNTFTGSLIRGRTSSTVRVFRGATDEGITVRTQTLDSFRAEQGIEHVDAVKVDVEGAEVHVLRGMHGLLGRPDRPMLMFEFCPATLQAAGFTPRELFEAIVGYGYTGHVIREGRLVPVESVIKPARRWLGGEPLDNYIFKPVRL
jgi:FkbM family methyltransferase